MAARLVASQADIYTLTENWATEIFCLSTKTPEAICMNLTADLTIFLPEYPPD